MPRGDHSRDPALKLQSTRSTYFECVGSRKQTAAPEVRRQPPILASTSGLKLPPPPGPHTSPLLTLSWEQKSGTRSPHGTKRAWNEVTQSKAGAPGTGKSWGLYLCKIFFFGGGFLGCTHIMWGGSQARGPMGAAATSSRQRRILNPLSEARDRTHNLMVLSRNP